MGGGKNGAGCGGVGVGGGEGGHKAGECRAKSLSNICSEEGPKNGILASRVRRLSLYMFLNLGVFSLILLQWEEFRREEKIDGV
jgi:hypothetical protein